MKKSLIVATIIISILFCGFIIIKSNDSDLKPSTIVVNNDNIELTLNKNTINSLQEDMTLSFKNKTAEKWFYGEYFNLEVESDNTWYQVPFKENATFSEIGIILESSSTNSYILKISNYFPTLAEGKYRIVHSMYNDNGEQNYITAPFEIKK